MIYDMVIGNRIEVADAMKLRQPAGDDRSGGKSAESVVQAWATDGDGENISATKQKIEAMMDTIVTAYDKQLDALYGEEALDISTDITVMEQMLQQEGLSSSDGKDGITLEL